MREYFGLLYCEMAEQLISSIAWTGVGLFMYATVLFIISIIIKRNDIADIAWGFAFVLVALFQLIHGHIHLLSIIIFSLVCIWGVRLSLHIYLRNHGKPEDFRYKKWRKEWGKNFYWRSYLQVYLLQCLFVLILSLPIIVIGSIESSHFTVFAAIGLIMWIMGFYFQAVGDYQLRRFSENKYNVGKFISSGLWKYSRHPNYFGEIVMWWSVFIITLPEPMTWLGIISPMTITILIRYVSGVPMLEEKYKDNESYQQYKKKTPMLIPKFW